MLYTYSFFTMPSRRFHKFFASAKFQSMKFKNLETRKNTVFFFLLLLLSLSFCFKKKKKMFRNQLTNLVAAHQILRTSTTKKLWGLREQMRQRQLELSQKAHSSNNTSSSSSAASLLPLSSRTPSETALSITIPLETDIDVRSEYMNPVGGLRMGKLLEDLDAFACTIAFNHAHDFEKTRLGQCRPGPANIVTATVERIDLMNSVQLDHNLTMTGKVIWVGNASMTVKCELVDNSTQKKLLQSNFLLVTVDEKGKPMECNPLIPTAESEKIDFALSEKDNEQRRMKRSAVKKANSPLIYDLQHLALHEHTLDVIREKSILQEKQQNAPLAHHQHQVPVKKTVQIATHLTQPQDANTSGKIFGGYLMQKAFEIGWIAAFSFFKKRPRFVCSDDVEFHRPVPAGSICVFTATVTYVKQPNLIEVSVRCEIMNATNQQQKQQENAANDEGANKTSTTPILEKKLSNTFEFVFTPSLKADNAAELQEPKGSKHSVTNHNIPDVYCETLEDWIQYCRGKDVVDDAIKVGERSGGQFRISELVL